MRATLSLRFRSEADPNSATEFYITLDGQALEGEKDSAKITASPVSRVAKNAMLNCTESITSWRASGA